MTELYEPASDFLKAIAAGDVPLSGNEFAEANLRLLIELMRDENSSNRDWATFLLSREDVDTPAVRNALLCAANDYDNFVRAEAINGLAQRDRDLALPLIQKALASESVAVLIFEAATLVAPSSLIEDLRRFTEPSNDAYADRSVSKALTACEAGVLAIT